MISDTLHRARAPALLKSHPNGLACMYPLPAPALARSGYSPYPVPAVQVWAKDTGGGAGNFISRERAMSYKWGDDELTDDTVRMPRWVAALLALRTRYGFEDAAQLHVSGAANSSQDEYASAIEGGRRRVEASIPSA